MNFPEVSDCSRQTVSRNLYINNRSKNFVKEVHFPLDNFDTARYNIRVVFRWCETRLDLHGGITQLVE